MPRHDDQEQEARTADTETDPLRNRKAGVELPRFISAQQFEGETGDRVDDPAHGQNGPVTRGVENTRPAAMR